jgi:hypothetical protein
MMFALDVCRDVQEDVTESANYGRSDLQAPRGPLPLPQVVLPISVASLLKCDDKSMTLLTLASKRHLNQSAVVVHILCVPVGK